MRASLPDLLYSLGVNHVMTSYETFPWSCTDSTSGQTCSAEVRMGPDGQDIEAEIQIVFDNPPEGSPAIMQWLWLRATPHSNSQPQENWSVTHLRIKNEDWNNKVYDWETKSIGLFRAVIISIDRGLIPDFDDLVEKEMRAKERFGDQRGGGAGKSPKIRAAQLLDMKKGQGF